MLSVEHTFIRLPSFCLDWSHCTNLSLYSSFTLIWGIYNLTNPSTPPQFFPNCCRFCPHSLLLGIWRLIRRLQHRLSIYEFCSGCFQGVSLSIASALFICWISAATKMNKQRKQYRGSFHWFLVFVPLQIGHRHAEHKTAWLALTTQRTLLAFFPISENKFQPASGLIKRNSPNPSASAVLRRLAEAWPAWGHCQGGGLSSAGRGQVAWGAPAALEEQESGTRREAALPWPW